MTTYREQLEGMQLFRFRRIKRFAMLLLLVLGIALSVYGMILGSASLKPLYLPIASFLSIGLVFLLIASVANLVFRTLEIRYARRDSQRFLIVRNSLRRAAPALVLTLVLGIALAIPPTHDAAGRAADSVVSGPLDSLTAVTLNFTSRDVFGIAHLTNAIVEIRAQGNPTIVVEFYDGRQNQTLSVSKNSPQPLPLVVATALVEYRLELRNFETQSVQYFVRFDRDLMPELGTVVPGVLLGLAVLNGLWIFHARPIRKRYEASSIYSVKYVEEDERGERTYADYYRMRTPTATGPSAPPPFTPPSEPVPVVPALAAPEPPPPPPPAPSAVADEPLPFPEIEPSPSDLLEDGSRLFTEGKYEKALAKFDEALEKEPDNVQALLAGAVALLRLGRKDEALGSYDRVLELDPRNAKAMAGRAQVFEADAQWARAADSWAEYLLVVPGDVDARMRRAEAILNTGDRAAAVKALEEALFLAPSDPRIRSRIESLTVNIPALLSRALVASASGRHEEAIADFDQILGVDPDNVNALVGKGVALRRAGRLDAALEALELALAKQPGNSAALRGKGSILEERGDFDGALDVYDDLLAWNPRDPDVWALQGSVLEKLGEPEEALASYVEARKLDPNDPDWKQRVDALESSRKGQEQFLEELFTIKGVGPSRARALLASGYKTAESVRSATEEDLVNVKGMTRAIARDLYRHFHSEPPPPPSDPPAPSD